MTGVQVEPRHTAIQTGSIERTDLLVTPLDATWIRAGNPDSRSLQLTESTDGQVSSGLWQCSAGEFKFIYLCDEVVHILEGEAIVRVPGAEYNLSAGDVVFFPKGLTAEWTVPTHIKKFWVCSSSTLPLWRRITNKIKRIWQMHGRAEAPAVMS